MTMNESWGYAPDDAHYKSRARARARPVRGREPRRQPAPQREPDGRRLAARRADARLDALARWMSAHAAAIHDSEPGLEPWQFYGPTTRHGDRVYLHLLMRPYDTVTVRGVPVKRVRAARVLASGRALEVDTRTLRARPHVQLRPARRARRSACPRASSIRWPTVLELEIAPKP